MEKEVTGGGGWRAEGGEGKEENEGEGTGMVDDRREKWMGVGAKEGKRGGGKGREEKSGKEEE